MLKKILIAILLVLLVVQFIRPGRNRASAKDNNDISNIYNVPGDVQSILAKACNDCHSNNTSYPWYTNIQPLGWWLQHHIDEGKEELNFSVFGSYKPKKQAHKLEEVAELVKSSEMPLSSYTLIHKNARLTDEEKDILLSWSEDLRRKILQQVQ